MTITEKGMTPTEALERLHELIDAPLSVEDVRKVAAVMGVTLADEKPEPGTYFYAFVTGSEAVVVDGEARLTPLSDTDDCLHFDQYNPANLTPARVVAEADVASAEKYREALATERDQWKAKANEWQELANLRTKQSRAVLSEPPARRWSDGGHDAEPEDTQKFVTTREAQPGVLSDEEELAIIQEVRSEGGQLTAEWTARRAMRKALAKHGGARELPNLGDLEEAVMSDLCAVHWDRSKPAGPKTVALLGGGAVGEKWMAIPVPLVAPFGFEVDNPAMVQEVWDTFVKPEQDAGNPQSAEMRVLMAILRAVNHGLTEQGATE